MEHDEMMGGGVWIFALLILLLIGGGGFGLNGGSGLAQTDLNLLNAIQNGQRDIETRVQEIGGENISAIKDSTFNIMNGIRDNEMLISNGFAQMQNCCCDLKGVVMENRYLDSQNTSKILEALAQNKIEALQSKVNELELKNAFCGVPRISNYAYGVAPQFAPYAGGTMIY